jgi:catechol 2,3-dioxygenase-like lactoylglutathione lyase family enzyme
MTPTSTSSEQLISGVDFVALPTHDVAASSEFYGKTLGLRRSVYMPERNFAEFETGNLTLSIIDAEKMGLEHHTQQTEIALHVEDVAEMRKTLEGLPHGVLQRPRRQRADAPPPLRATQHRSLSERSGRAAIN